MKNVLVCIPCLLIGGTEIQTFHLVEALVAGGHTITVVCYFEYNFDVVQQFKATGAQVVCLSAYGTRPAEGRALRKFLYAGLKRTVLEYHPDIAHVQYMAPGALPLWYLHRLGVKTLIATLHTNADIYASLRRIHFLQRHWVKVFTCVTQSAEQSFFGTAHLYDFETPLSGHDHFTIYNCLPSDLVVHPHQPHDGVNIGAILRLEKIKGADFLLPAFAQVYHLFPDAHLSIVGDGSLRGEMEQQQKQLNIPSSAISWKGRLTSKELPAQYAQIDVAWVPSRSEGFGLSALEAMAQGCPVIASNIGGLSEIVQDNVNGILFQSQDANDLAKKTIELLSDNDRRQSLSQAGTERARDFTFNHYRDLVQNLYSKLGE